MYLSGLSSLVSVPPLGCGRQACFLALFPPSVITVVPNTYQVLSKYLGEGWMDGWMDDGGIGSFLNQYRKPDASYTSLFCVL